MKRYLTNLLAIIISICNVSCDLEKTDNETHLYNNEVIIKRVKTNVEEAKVLSDIAIINETIIYSSELLLKNRNEYRVKMISNKLYKDHLKINKYLSDLAERKLILLPNKKDVSNMEMLLKIDKSRFSKAHLNSIKVLLEKEVVMLDYLSSITNDVDFKVLTVKTLLLLNYNLEQIQNNLNRISNN